MSRLLTDAIDNTAPASPPIKHCCRPLQYLDAPDITETAHILRIVANTIEEQIADTGKAANTECIKACVRRIRNPGNAAQGICEGASTVRCNVFHRNAVDCLRYIACLGVGSGGGIDRSRTRIIVAALAADLDGGQSGLVAGFVSCVSVVERRRDRADGDRQRPEPYGAGEASVSMTTERKK